MLALRETFLSLSWSFLGDVFPDSIKILDGFRREEVIAHELHVS